MAAERVQCLLFVTDENSGKSRKSKRAQKAQSSIKGYALLPQAFKDAHPQIYNCFSRNDFRVMVEDQADPSLQSTLKNSKLRMFDVQVTPDDAPPASSTSDPLCMLVDPFDREVIGLLLGRDFNVLCLDQDEYTGHESAVKDNLAALERLLTVDPDIAYQHFKTGTILHFAVKKAEESLIKLVLRCGGDINAMRTDGLTPLHIAAKKGFLEIVETLVQHGAAVNAGAEVESMGGWTPLVFACNNNHTNIVKALLESGANVDQQFNCNVMYNYYGEYLGHVTRSNVLYYAVTLHRDANLLETILDYQPNPNDEFNKQAFQFLLVCLEDEHISVFEKMRQIGFTIGIKDIQRSVKFLCGAIHKNYFELVQAMVEGGASITDVYESVRRGKFTPLHMAAGYADERIIKFLMAHGADINVMTEGKHRTPMNWAVKAGNTRAFQLLIANNANFRNEVDDLLEQAATNGLNEMVEFFLLNCTPANLKHGYYPAIIRAASAGHMKVIETLFKYGAELSPECDYASNATHGAYYQGYPEILQKLLDYNFINIKLVYGFTNCTYFDLLPPPLHDSKFAEKLNSLSIIARHIIKLEAANLLVLNQDLEPIWNESEGIHDFRERCEKEIARLKSEKVDGSELTYYDILIGNLYQLVGYAKNESFVNITKKSDFQTMFPIYASVIHYQIEKGYQRVELMKKGIEICRQLFKEVHSFDELPYELREKIINYLSNRDLISLDHAWPKRSCRKDADTSTPPQLSNTAALQ